MSDRPQPILHATTGRDQKIALRAAAARDVDAVFTTATDPETLRWTNLSLDYDIDKAISFVREYAPGWWERDHGAAWVIAGSDDNYVGQLDLRVDTRDKQVADVGFLTAPHARGKGYMTAALRAAVEFGFQQLDLERIEWRAHVGNDASRRVAEKVGFKMEGVQRCGVAQRGERHDAWLAAVLKADLA